ncbi:MAG: depupylase/deamidase Dop [Chloroherpetonaceae bacterium]|nr:depupylase/deamidase Dop [Chthonomonadaceae bacterium]MDW8208847.1 depupylase/deamidase Dop [Chloroherpetonaceae bacterium]
MDRLVGIETEYGIIVDGRGPNDWIHESIAVVQSYSGPSVRGWNYRGEDPRRDMRGFTVQHLATNPDDAQFDTPAMSREEERTDRVLANGARLYNDHGHPEYATPECRSLRDLVAHDRAGERIVLAAAQRHAAHTGRAVTLYKNNTDFHGASYGTHEGYLMRREVAPETIIQTLLPFFVTRQIFAGAGKVGVENDGSTRNVDYQISQRADFFTVEASVDTLHNRPIVNTRDEPHATPSRYRRLHVICGDANMSEYATALKVGTTCLVLALMEAGWKAPVRLADPVRAVRQVSRDLTLQQKLDCFGGQSLTAIEIQRLYQQAALQELRGRDEDTDWTLTEWAATLDALEHDPLTLSDSLDWVAKYCLLNTFRQEEGLDWKAPHLQSLDLTYHSVDPEQGLYYGLEQAGVMRRLVTEGRIQAAMSCPPADTRAFIRGLFVERFGQAVRSIGWNGILFEYHGENLLFDMNPLVEANVSLLNEELAAAETLDEFVAVIQRKPEQD